MLAHLKSFLNLENYSHFILSYTFFFKDRNVFLLISLGVCKPGAQDFGFNEPASPSLIVLMCHGCII